MIDRAKFRQLVESREILVMPGAYDALSAKLVEASGFPVAYMTGYGQSASKLGAPDVGLMTMSEMAERAKDMCAAVSIPVICDGDTGFGNVVNLVRTVREYERAGAAAIQIEDQRMPKKCGHMLGRQVVDAQEMVNKIQAACAARHDPDFLIIARTDARTNHGVEEAIRRAKLYEQAGADIIFGGDAPGQPVRHKAHHRQHGGGRQKPLSLRRRAAGPGLPAGGVSGADAVCGHGLRAGRSFRAEGQGHGGPDLRQNGELYAVQ